MLCRAAPRPRRCNPAAPWPCSAPIKPQRDAAAHSSVATTTHPYHDSRSDGCRQHGASSPRRACAVPQSPQPGAGAQQTHKLHSARSTPTSGAHCGPRLPRAAAAAAATGAR
jgi:hypothetical protein